MIEISFLFGLFLPQIWGQHGLPVFPESASVPQLKLIKVMSIDQPYGAQLSGLTFYHDHLLTISDKHSDKIFEIVFENESAHLEVFQTFCVPENADFDLEGITIGQNDELYVLSERYNRILTIRGDQIEAEWASPAFTEAGRAQGLLMNLNAGLEGVAFCPPDLLVVAAERQNRGILSWQIGKDEDSIVVAPFDDTRFYNYGDRNPDFSGLCYYNGNLIALQRNFHLVSVMKGYREGNLIESSSWSYAQIENDPKYRFSDHRYGLAEGICVGLNCLFIVLDNNQDHLERDPADSRTLLLVFELPQELREQ